MPWAALEPRCRHPHIDQIAQQGSICRRAYSNNPVCGPYRGTLLTGCYSSRTGILRNGDPLPDDRPLFAGYLIMPTIRRRG